MEPIEIRYNVLVYPRRGGRRWVSVVVEVDEDWTKKEAEQEAIDIANEIVKADAETGRRARRGYRGPRVVQVGIIL